MLNKLIPFLLCFISINCFAQSGHSKTELVKTDEGFKLLRNGGYYYVNGAGGNTYLKELADIGGNSIRTWATENGLAVLDSAHKHGLTVCMGLSLSEIS